MTAEQSVQQLPKLGETWIDPRTEGSFVSEGNKRTIQFKDVPRRIKISEVNYPGDGTGEVRGVYRDGEYKGEIFSAPMHQFLDVWQREDDVRKTNL